MLLDAALEKIPLLKFKVIGGSQDRQHQEIGFGCGARGHTMLEIAQNFKQLAMYLVDGDDLYLIHCNDDDHEKVLLEKGFRARVQSFSDEPV